MKHPEAAVILEKAWEQNLSVEMTGTMGIGKSFLIRKTAEKAAAHSHHKFYNWAALTKAQKDTLFLSAMALNALTDDEYRQLQEGSKDMALDQAKQAAQAHVFSDLRVAQMDPSDLRGVLKFTTGGESCDWCETRMFQVLAAHHMHGTLLLDEMNQAPPAVQNACFSIILDRTIGELRLSDGVGIVAAGNRAEDRAYVFEFPAPLQNRFVHIDLDIPLVEAWCKEFAYPAGIDHRILAFLSFEPDSLMAKPELFKNAKVRAFPTPRTWEMCSRMLTEVPDNAVYDMSRTVIGDGTAARFNEFIALTQKIDVDKIMANPDYEIPKVKDLQYRWALVSAVTGWYTHNKRKLGDMMKIVKALYDDGQVEFSACLLSMLKASPVHQKHNQNEFREKLKNADLDIYNFIRENLVKFYV